MTLYNIIIINNDEKESNDLKEELLKFEECEFSRIFIADSDKLAFYFLHKSIIFDYEVDLIVKYIHNDDDISTLHLFQRLGSISNVKFILCNGNYEGNEQNAKILSDDQIVEIFDLPVDNKTLAKKITDYFICKENDNDNLPVALSPKKYVRSAILSINCNESLNGFKYLFTGAMLCIIDQRKLAMKAKTLCEEIAFIYNAERITVDRTIRMYIKQGVVDDELATFGELTDVNTTLIKMSLMSVISAIVNSYYKNLKEVNVNN